MNKEIVIVIIILGIVIGGLAYYAYNIYGGMSSSTATMTTFVQSQITAASYTTTTSTSVLSDVEIEAIKYMAEEEKLAYDVYTKLAQMYPDVPVFANIAKSEETHVNAVLALAEKYHINMELREPGVYNNTHIQELYDQLINIGSQGLEEALKVGALIEETDIKDLQEWIAKVQRDDIKQVFECLMMGSRNHLRAFTSTLQRMFGVEYEPQVISMDEYEQIINTPMETGRTECSLLGINLGINATITRGYGKQ